MASQRRTPSPDDGKTYFEEQREILIGEIATSFEHALANINKLNRSLEAIITVGNEFSSVEALWSQFEGVMGKDEQEGEGEETRDDEGREESRDDGEEGYEQEEDEGENDDEEESVVEDRGRR